MQRLFTWLQLQCFNICSFNELKHIMGKRDQIEFTNAQPYKPKRKNKQLPCTPESKWHTVQTLKTEGRFGESILPYTSTSLPFLFQFYYGAGKGLWNFDISHEWTTLPSPSFSPGRFSFVHCCIPYGTLCRLFGKGSIFSIHPVSTSIVHVYGFIKQCKK